MLLSLICFFALTRGLCLPLHSHVILYFLAVQVRKGSRTLSAYVTPLKRAHLFRSRSQLGLPVLAFSVQTMDPISIISLVEGSMSLILQCGSTIKNLNDLAGRYKKAPLSLSSIIQEVDIIELAWKRIKDWFESYRNEAGDGELLERLDKSLKCGTNVISALQHDLLDYGLMKVGFMQRSKLTWNEKTLRNHQDRIRGQVHAMSLLLQVIELPTSKARSKQLQTAQNTFLKSDESAYSIVPSRMSISSSARDSVFSVESGELIYDRWSFEGDLFSARAYKRTYAKSIISSILHSKMGKPKDGARTILSNDAISAVTDDGLEASVNGALGGTANNAPKSGGEQGLVLLSEEKSKDRECYGEFSCLDFVAIPGLTEEPLQTWTHPKTRYFWLRDSFPVEFNPARIFTFNYPSYPLLSDDKANMNVYAEKLLSDLKTVGSDNKSRRLIFIGHSYGGLLCKQALVIAKDDVRYSGIARNTLLFCFSSTPGFFDSNICSSPFPPLDLGHLVDLYLESLGARILEGSPRSSLLETLHTNTGNLLEITDAFNNFRKDFTNGSIHPAHVINFCERDSTTAVGREVSVTRKLLSSYWLILRLI